MWGVSVLVFLWLCGADSAGAASLDWPAPEYVWEVLTTEEPRKPSTASAQAVEPATEASQAPLHRLRSS